MSDLDVALARLAGWAAADPERHWYLQGGSHQAVGKSGPSFYVLLWEQLYPEDDDEPIKGHGTTMESAIDAALSRFGP